jgi:hypothetical protein
LVLHRTAATTGKGIDLANLLANNDDDTSKNRMTVSWINSKLFMQFHIHAEKQQFPARDYKVDEQMNE